MTVQTWVSAARTQQATWTGLGHTVRFAQDLQGKDLVVVAGLGILQAHQPDASKGA